MEGAISVSVLYRLLASVRMFLIMLVWGCPRSISSLRVLRYVICLAIEMHNELLGTGASTETRVIGGSLWAFSVIYKLLCIAIASLLSALVAKCHT